MACQYSEKCGSVTFIISVLVLALFVLNGGLIIANRMLQGEIAGQQAALQVNNTKIGQNNAFANINQSLLKALTTAAITRKDDQIKALLIQNNINLSPDASSAAAPEAPAAK